MERLADAERDRDQVGQQRQPEAERDRDRHLLLDQGENAHIAEIALAEIEPAVVPQHQGEALIGRLVEAEFLLEAGDEFPTAPLCTSLPAIPRTPRTPPHLPPPPPP